MPKLLVCRCGNRSSREHSAIATGNKGHNLAVKVGEEVNIEHARDLERSILVIGQCRPTNR